MPEFENNPFGSSPYTEAYRPSAPLPPPPPVARERAMYELRPLSLGEILDRTFSVYRQRFWVFAGLASISAVVPTLSTFVQLTFGMSTMGRRVVPAQAQRQLAVMLVTVLISSLIYLLVYSLTQAATVKAVSAVYLGEDTSIKSALSAVWKRWFRYILIALWQGWSAMWVPLLLLVPAFALMAVPSLTWMGGLLILLVFPGMVYGVIAAIRNSLGVVASVVEDLKVRRSMRRSKDLVAGHKARVFGLFLLVIVLRMVASGMQGILGVFLGLSTGVTRYVLEAVALTVTFISTTLVVPVSAIALCLFYIDERVRKEGFDIEVLMLRGATPPPPPPSELPSPFTTELA